MAKEPRRVIDPFPLFTAVVTRLGAPAPVREFVFLPDRKFRLDYAWPEHRVGVEVEGGLFSRSPRARMAHATPSAIKRDMTKHNLAVLAGWRLLRFTPDQLIEGAASVVQLLTGEGKKNELRIDASVHRGLSP